MASDIREPAWMPRALRPAPPLLRDARATARRMFGDRLERARSIPGWLHPDHADTLCHLASVCPEGHIVELGSFKGKSTVFLATGMGAQRRMIAVDPHTLPLFGSRNDRAASDHSAHEADAGHSWPVFLKTLEDWGVRDRISIERAFSYDFRQAFHEPIALLWIDADHSYAAVKRDIEDWVDLVMPGGYLAFHDTHPRRGHDLHQRGDAETRNVYDAITDSGLPDDRGFRTVLQLRNAWFMRRNPTS